MTDPRKTVATILAVQFQATFALFIITFGASLASALRFDHDELQAPSIDWPDQQLERSEQHSGGGGSWSHWWSYDGISGPDYWNINKNWRLCSAGRKQSPVNIRTERLVFDHLLGPLEFDWQRLAANQLGGSSHVFRPHHQPARQQPSGASSSSTAGGERQQQGTVPGRLINSGRGVELWLERASPFDLVAAAHDLGGGATTKSAQAKIDHPPPLPHRPGHNEHNGEQQANTGGSQQQQQNYEQLILARGPLAYEYKLFKIELHSASATGVRDENNNNNNDDGEDDEQEEEEGNERHEGRAQKTPQARGPQRQPAHTGEHLIDGRPLEAELQLHFYNKHLAPGAREALRMANEQPLSSLFAVISVFVSTHNQEGPNEGGGQISAQNSTEEPLDFLLDRLDELPAGRTGKLDGLDLLLRRADLEALLVDTRQYVTYQGSMNRPPCAESVDWIILNKALQVRPSKFARLFEIQKSGASLVENVRPTAPLHGRLLRTTISNLRAPLADQQQHRQAAKCASIAHEARQKVPECNSTRPTTMEHNRPKPDSSAATVGLHRQQQCSMRPNYVYRYSAQGL